MTIKIAKNVSHRAQLEIAKRPPIEKKNGLKHKLGLACDREARKEKAAVGYIT